MRNVILVLCMTLASLLAPAYADDVYTTEDTKIGVLLADPEAKAILEKYIPQNMEDKRFTMAKSFTLSFIASYDEKGELTDENLEEMDKELAALGQE
jgi:hypothetical protein